MSADLTKYHCSIIEDFKELENFKDDWNSLHNKQSFQSYFSSYSFNKTWWHTYGNDYDLKTIVIKQNNNVALIAPFITAKNNDNSWTLIGNTRADYNQIVCKENDQELFSNFIEYLYKHPWSEIKIRRIAANNQWLSYFSNSYSSSDNKIKKMSLLINIFQPLIEKNHYKEHPYVNAEKLKELQNLFNKKNIKYRLKKIIKLGNLEFKQLSSKDCSNAILDQYFNLHLKRCDYRDQNLFFSHDINRNFFKNLIENDNENLGGVHLDILTLDDKLIAAHFGFSWKKCYYIYKSCYDPDYREYAPGKVLRAEIFRHCYNNGYREVDLLNGLENYKNEYLSNIRETVHLTLRTRSELLKKR